MDTVTYPHGGVERRLNEMFVAVRLRIDEHKDLALRLQAPWTPGLVFLDPDGQVVHRAQGYFPPEEMEHLLHIGRGMVDFTRGRYEEALAQFAKAADDPERTAEQAEALYWKGACQIKTGDKEGVKASWGRLQTAFPDTVWAKKASVVRAA